MPEEPTVIVWSRPACVQCNAVKRFLTKNDIPYVEKQVGDDLAKVAEFQAAGLMMAPIVESSTEPTFSGFRTDILERIKEAHKDS